MSYRPRSLRRRALTALALAAALAAPATVTARPAAADPGVEPADVTITLGPGGSAEIAKVVHTPTVPPKPDLIFVADTTGSMGGAIGNVRANAADILSSVVAAQPQAQFAVAEYKDFTDPYAFRLNQGLTGDLSAVQAGINAWAAAGGGDVPEANLNALYEVSTGAVTFRPDGTRIAVIFGDAPSHDPSGGHSLADTVAALQAAGVRVVAVDVGAMNASGQFTTITSATGGQLLSGVPADEVADAILAGIKAIEVTVTPQVVSCDAPLSLSFAPASRTVTSGADATFTESVQLGGGAAAGSYHCVVDFLIDGTSRGFTQRLTVNVPGLRIDDVTVNEGAGSATFTVTRTGPTDTAVSAAYATANGTAVAPADYATTGGTVSLAPGQTTKTVTVPVVDDAVDEPDETFTVRLSAPVGAALTDPTGVGTIVDNDRDGTFSCTSTALRIAGLTAGRANPDDVPCVDDHEQVASAQLTSGLVNVRTGVLEAATDSRPDHPAASAPAAGDAGSATARVDSTRITVAGLVTIELGVIQASASATCAPAPGGLAPVFAGSSTVASLKVNGVPVTVGSAPLTVPLVVGSLRINSTETTATTITQRAVVLDTPLTDVVIAEAKANVEGTPAHPAGNPCRA
ncbi:Calx-beta domain-containing protein [Micromonospora sp. NPDC049559]|uniref:Calx-beta domain-containing protein n=1 Tax=Micromonospora sp. NPDC049559 TaxID=3155923 RepID=UPI0034310B8F